MKKSHLAIGFLLALGLILIINLSVAAKVGKPVLVSPENNVNENDNTPTFEWENGDFADNHKLVIDNDQDWTDDNVYENENAGIEKNNTTVEIENELPDGVYWWRVAAENSSSGDENWSENTWTFTIDTVAPPTPSLNQPEDSENIRDNTPNLKWENIASDENTLPVKYYVAVSDNFEFPDENENSGWISDDNWVTSELSDDNWYWHVRARDNAGNVGDSSGWYKLQLDKHMPRIASPVEGENTNDNTPTFKWDNVAIVDNFELQIDNDSNFSSLSYDNKGITENKVDPIENQLPDEKYYWRVRSYKNGSPSLFSSENSFRVDTLAPATPSMSSPDNNYENNDNTPILKWESVSENTTPVKYRAAVSDNSKFPYENENSGWQTGTSWTTPELAEGAWYWRVRAKDNAGNIGDNSQRSFTVDVTLPSISGLTESSVTSNSATIEWTTDEPADTFVEWGPDTSYGSSSLDSSLATSHSVSLSSLSPENTYHYRVKSTDNAGNSTTSSDQQFTTLALEAPTSSVDLIDPYWRTSGFTIGATASDADGSVENITLYYRYRENSDANWGNWTSFATDTDASDEWSWTFTPENGDGLYEFYTRAVDDDAQVEAAPSSADEDFGFDNTSPTLSSVQINGENTVTTSGSVTITINARDNTSGLDEVRFRNDNKAWASWESFTTEKSYDFSLPEGTKTVYVQVKDTVGLTSNVLENSILLENATFTESVGSISENSNKAADFSSWGLAVKEVTLYAKKNISNANVDLRVLEGKPTEITVEEPGTTAFYFEVKTNAPTENLDKITIRFDVKRSWLNEQGVEPTDVKAWKLNNTWKSIPVAIENENTTHVQYSATATDLSWFTVTAEAPAGGIELVWIIIAIAIIAVIIIAVVGWKWTQTHGAILKRKRSGIPKNVDYNHLG